MDQPTAGAGVEGDGGAGRCVEPDGDTCRRRAVAGTGQGDLRMARGRPASARAFDRGDAGGARRCLRLRLRRRQRQLLPALHRRPERLPRLPDEHRNGEWKLWREGEPFNQRFTATISEDGNKIEGRWEYEAGEGWQTDFDLVYTRVR